MKRSTLSDTVTYTIWSMPPHPMWRYTMNSVNADIANLLWDTIPSPVQPIVLSSLWQKIRKL